MHAQVEQVTELTRISSVGPTWLKHFASNLQKNFPLLTVNSPKVTLREILLIEDNLDKLSIQNLNIRPDLSIKIQSLSRLKQVSKEQKTINILIPDSTFAKISAGKLSYAPLLHYILLIISSPQQILPPLVIFSTKPKESLKIQFKDYQLLLESTELKQMVAWHEQVIEPQLPKRIKINLKKVITDHPKISNFSPIQNIRRASQRSYSIFNFLMRYSLTTAVIILLLAISAISIYSFKAYSILSSLKLSYQNSQYAAASIYSQQLKNHCQLLDLPYSNSLFVNDFIKSALQLPQACISIADLSISTSQLLNQYYPFSSNFNFTQFTTDLANWQNRFQQTTLYLDNPIIKKQIATQLKLNISREQISAISALISSAKELSTNFQYFFGFEKPLKVIVLFQNNNEIRPTGGFIGSLATLTIDKGVITNMEIKDVYDYDGQLLGHVNPPLALKNYLNQPAWYLRDSNWSPDFPTSAQNAAWFLDKSAKLNPNLIIAIDTEVLKTLLAELGPFDIQGIEQPITKDNYQAILNDHIETDFFPGSRRKTNSLSQLGTDIKYRLTNSTSQQQLNLASKVIPLLNEKHILIHSDNSQLNKNLTTLNWNGRVGQVAGINTDSEILYFSPTEANLGVNKANKFIDRSYKLKLNFNNQATSDLQINYVNNSQSESKLEGPYETYIQFPTNTLNSPELFLLNNYKAKQLNLEIEKTNNIETAGSFFTVPIQSSQTLSLTQNHHNSKDYVIYFRKQPGTLNDPINIDISASSNQLITLTDVNQGSTLTANTLLTYNTNLKSDLFLKINLK